MKKWHMESKEKRKRGKSDEQVTRKLTRWFGVMGVVDTITGK